MRFSIISPSFNQAQFIRRTLHSVSAQTARDLEHLVFDAGSTDGTVEILQGYKGECPFARVTVEPDDGQADGINKGFRASTGDVLAWLNTDDFYPSSDVLDAVEREFRTHPDIDVVYGRGLFIDVYGRKIRDAFIHTDPGRLDALFVYSVGVLQPATFFRRQIIDKVGVLDTSLTCAFDYEFWVRIVKAGSRFWFLDKILAHATFHDHAKSSSLRSKQLLESIEVTRRYYGFGSAEWIRRYTECEIAGKNGIIDEPDFTKGQAIEIGKIAQRKFAAVNNSKHALSAIATAPNDPSFSLTRQMAVDAGVLNLSRIIVTTFDSQYFDQGLTLIASVHRHHGREQPIFVYDLGLEPGQRARLTDQLESVFVVDYPHDAASSYPGYLDPKNYGYKCAAIWHARHFATAGGVILWIDAGVSLLKPVDEIFDIVLQMGVFFVNHDDKKNWPFFNRTFTHPEAMRRMNVTCDEMLGEHLCSCLMGYQIGGPFEHVFAEADVYSRDEKTVVWEKHPIPGTSTPEGVRCAPPDQSRLLSWKVNRPLYRLATEAELDSVFGYLGHRQDQSILSILAARYGALLQSARVFCISDEQSSTASKLNWESGGFSKQIKPNVDIPVHAAGTVTYHHRGIYRNFERLRYTMRQSETLVVLGNGPSLRGFDFERFRPFDVIGMNAAYRYWDEIRWYPNYYICLDKVVGQSHKEPIIRLIRTRRENGIRLFVLRRNLIDLFPEDIRGCEAILDFEALREAMLLFAPMPITTGSHASLVGAMLGYQRMIIMGVDCNYVEKVDGAVERGGTVLEIAETPSENPNYFFTGYQIEGDRYNIPNPIGPNLHLDSWRAVAPVLAERGIEVWNGSEISRVDVFPYHDFSEVEKLGSKAREGATTAEQRITVVQPNGNLPTYERDAHACVDEAKFVSTLFGPSARAERIMIDVGAHFGGSAQHFVDRGWKIYCFEPDPANRERLVAKFGRTPSIVIDSRAVGGKPECGKAFFSSSESTGISGLSAFHHTHQQVGVVDVTTIADIVEQYGLSRIDFLKIDVEGWDFSVLRGVPWDRIRPSVIECEFEDAKTGALGYTYKDMADFLVAKGYVVYISEWHPIVRYGVRHDWRRLVRYPEPLRTPQAWGNLLTFLEDPGPRAIAKALGVSVTNSRNSPVKPTPRPRQSSGVSASEGAARGANPVGRPKGNVAGVRRWQQVFSLALLWKLRRWAVLDYMKFPSWVKTRSLVVFRIGQFVMWSLRPARRRPLALLGLLFTLAVLTAAPAYPPMWEYRIFVWGAAGALLLSAMGVIGVAVAEMAVRRLLKLQRANVEARLRAARRGSDSRTAALEASVTALGKNLQALAARQESAEDELRALKQQAAALAGQKDLQALAARQESAEDELRALKQQAAALAGQKDLQALAARQESAEDELHALKQQAAALAEQVECNAAFQRFNRVLTPAQVETLRNLWSKRLGLRLTGPSLAYIAHRIRNIEQNAVGRLATSIEDAVLRTLVSSAVKNDTLEVLEIGVLFGIGLGIIYENNRGRYRSIHITAIDPVAGYYGEGKPDVLLNIPVSKPIFWHNMERAGVPRDDVTLIDALSSSDGAIERASARKYDLLIIDGDHSYAGVKADFENYIDFVSRGGFIIFDDYDSADWPEVKRFIDEEVLTDSRVAHVGSEWKTAVFRVGKIASS